MVGAFEHSVERGFEVLSHGAKVTHNLIAHLILKGFSCDVIRKLIAAGAVNPHELRKCSVLDSGELSLNSRRIGCAQFDRKSTTLYEANSTLMYAAVKASRTDIITMLLDEYNVDINACIHYCGGTALSHAVYSNNVPIVEYFCERSKHQNKNICLSVIYYDREQLTNEVFEMIDNASNRIT
jgi:ankyrin repeat protein